MAAQIDKGTPPPQVQKLKAIEDAVLSGEELSPVEDKSPQVVKENTRRVEDVVNLQKVTLEHSLYSISCGAQDISVSEHQIAIKLPKTSHFSFEPKVNSSFNIHFLGKTYKVVYLGGVFNFPNDNTWAITFLMDRSNDDKELES